MTILLRKGKVLMGLKKDGSLAGYVNFPGGHIEATDDDYFSASERECREETGFITKDGKLLAEIHIWRKTEKKHVIVYVILSQKFTGKLRVDTTEFEYLKFIPINKVFKENLAPGE
ncbi:MAG: NUDIX domain-containing protein, partial [Patescibacteria group bacterium]